MLLRGGGGGIASDCDSAGELECHASTDRLAKLFRSCVVSCFLGRFGWISGPIGGGSPLPHTETGFFAGAPRMRARTALREKSKKKLPVFWAQKKPPVFSKKLPVFSRNSH
jgi:hypothetical protein